MGPVCMPHLSCTSMSSGAHKTHHEGLCGAGFYNLQQWMAQHRAATAAHRARATVALASGSAPTYCPF